MSEEDVAKAYDKIASLSDLKVTFSKSVTDAADWMAAVVQFGKLFGMTPCTCDDHDTEVVFRLSASEPCPLCVLLSRDP